MARKANSIDHSEKRLMYKMRRQGHTWKQIVKFFGRDYKRVEAAVDDYLTPYRKVEDHEADSRLNRLNDSAPKIRCRCCGLPSTVVVKDDPRTCMACDMREKRQLSLRVRQVAV